MLSLKPLRNKLEKYLDSFDRAFMSDTGVRFRNWRLGIHRSDYTFRADQLAFVHLPKTGGTSLNIILRDSGKDRFTGVSQHRAISKRCQPGFYRYFTVMRNPVDRVWSFYQMALRSKAKGGGPYGHLVGRGLEFFLLHCWETRNMACRYYSGRVFFEPSSRTCEKAWRNLKRFCAVLDFDCLATEASSFLADCGITRSDFPHANRHPYAGPENEALALIQKYNSLDIEIYRRWKEMRGKSLCSSPSLGSAP